VTFAGIVILVRDEVVLNALALIVVTLSGIVMFARDEALLNALTPIEVS
jgi:hypothetical protein